MRRRNALILLIAREISVPACALILQAVCMSSRLNFVVSVCRTEPLPRASEGEGGDLRAAKRDCRQHGDLPVLGGGVSAVGVVREARFAQAKTEGFWDGRKSPRILQHHARAASGFPRGL